MAQAEHYRYKQQYAAQYMVYARRSFSSAKTGRNWLFASQAMVKPDQKFCLPDIYKRI